MIESDPIYFLFKYTKPNDSFTRLIIYDHSLMSPYRLRKKGLLLDPGL